MGTLVKEKKEYISSILIFKYNIYKHCSDYIKTLFRKLFYTFMILEFQIHKTNSENLIVFKGYVVICIDSNTAGMITSSSS